MKFENYINCINEIIRVILNSIVLLSILSACIIMLWSTMVDYYPQGLIIGLVQNTYSVVYLSIERFYRYKIKVKGLDNNVSKA